jgi:AraC-like DNA-binding protein
LNNVISKIGFENPRLRGVGIDVLTLHEIRQRAPKTLIAPQRVGFCFLMLIQEGTCRHTIDFVDYDLRPGSVVFLRPGQVQQWHMHDEMQGLVVLVADQNMMPSNGRLEQSLNLLSLDQWPAAVTLSMGLFLQAYSDAIRLRNEILNFNDSDRETAIIWHAMLALLLRLARELRVGDVSEQAKPDADIFRMFSQAIENSFNKRLTVLDYARKLGYAQSTLSRACVATVQMTAKEVIDQRVVLEAKRLLVHSNATSAQIGYQLGFPEPSNFVKFFRRMTGTTPLVYKKKQHIETFQQHASP